MGGNNTSPRVDLDINDNKIKNLETEIDKFMERQTANINKFFIDKKFKKQNIEYIIDGNNNIQMENDDDDATSLTDYAIQWTIEGSNCSNSTNCQLTLFNIGGFLGANGFLYQISLFYYYFMKIPTENRKEESIQKDINDCLEYIDNGNISELNIKWNVDLNENYLNNLKSAKEFLINLFHEKLTDGVFEHITNKIIRRIWKYCTKKVRNFGAIIFYGLTKKLTKEEYIKEKNRINRNYLIKDILKKLELKTFAEKNIFIIASDNDIDSWKNYGATFMGYYLKGANDKYPFARKLSENVKDGFNIGNNKNSQNKILFDFYYTKINDIKQFFIRNQQKIDNINKKGGIGVEIDIQEIAKDIDDYNEKYKHEDVIDNAPISQISTSSSEYNINQQNAEIKDNFVYNENAFLKVNQNNLYNDPINQIFISREKSYFENDPERALEFIRVKRELNNDYFYQAKVHNDHNVNEIKYSRNNQLIPDASVDNGYEIEKGGLIFEGY